MKKLIFLLTLLSSLIGFSQTKTEYIESQKLRKNRQISIITPPSYDSEKDKKYPVIYILDGDYLLESFNGTLQYAYYFDDLPEAILVGIHQGKNGDRFVDTATTDEGLPNESSGNFYEFLTTEVVPFIDKNYRTVPYKAIAGHDLTAGFLNFFLYKDNPVFNAYIAICPDFPVDMEYRLPGRLNSINKPISYFLASSEGDLDRIFNSCNLVNEEVAKLEVSNLSFKYATYDALSHYSIVPNAIPNALYHIFKGYQPITKDDFQKELNTLTTGHAKYLTDKYKKIQDLFGLNKKIRLIDILATMQAIKDNKADEEYKELTKIAEKNYPKTTLPAFIESIYYENIGDINKAITAVEKGYNSTEIDIFTKSSLVERLEELKLKKANNNTKKNE